MKTIQNAIYFNGISSSFNEISIRVENIKLVLLDSDLNLLSEIHPFQINQKISVFSKSDFKIYFGENPEKMIWIRNKKDAQILLDWLNNFKIKPTSVHHYFTPTVLVTLGIIAAILFSIYLSIPLLSGLIADQISIETENKLGKNFLEEMLNKNGEQIHSETLDSLNQIFIQSIDSKEIPVKIFVVKSNLVNAVTLPGGNIIVYTGMIDKLNSAESYYALLGHEIGHAAHRHVMKGIVQNSFILIGFSFLFGDVSSLLGQAGAEITTLSYNRDYEREADLYAIEQLNQHHISIQGMVDLFNELKKENDLSSELEFISSHPITEERLKKAQEFLTTQKNVQKTPVELTDAWMRIKEESQENF